MADVAFNNFQQMQFQAQAAQAKARQMNVGIPLDMMANGSVPGGSLIIADTFTPSNPNDKLSHGEMVNMSARGNGFKGNVLTLAQQGAEATSSKAFDADGQLLFAKHTPEETRKLVASYGTNDATALLQRQTKMVDMATASGAKNSALNISMGGSVASQTAKLYSEAGMAWNPKLSPEAQAAGKTMATNLAGAYGLSVDKMMSSDPKISGPERARLAESLAKGLDGAVSGSPEVAKAKRDFATSVGRFEAGRNSVVIAAGNEGDYAQQIGDDAHGNRPSKLPKSFNTNFLDTPAATMVGATRWSQGASGPVERRAEYSNVNSSVDIYASGSLSTNGDQKAEDHGTSFAAPRVAATMAALHKANPKMSSSQIEGLMRNSLTHSLNTGGGDVSVLDYGKSSDFMVGRAPQ